MVFKRIILPINKSDESLKTAKKAIHLAEKLNIHLTAIYVLNTKIYAGTIPPNQMYAYRFYEDIKNEHKENAHKFLNKIEKVGHEKNIDVQTILTEGSLDKEILKEAEKNDLIVMRGNNTSKIDRIFSRNMSDKILHSAPSNVMIIR